MAARSLGGFGIALACAALTLFFLALGFPYDRLGETLVAGVESSTGARIGFSDLGPFVSLAGPGLEARGVRIITPDGSRVDLNRARVRPAWSLAWLRLAPALHLDLAGPGGSVDGVATFGAAPGFEGRLEAIDLASLPLESAWPGATLAGVIDADLDLVSGETGPEGRLDFEAREGSIGLADLRSAVPFDRLTGALAFGGERLVTIEAARLDGQLFDADLSGEIGAAASFAVAPLTLDVQIVATPIFRPVLQRAGIRPDAEGQARVRIEGTPGSPLLR